MTYEVNEGSSFQIAGLLIDESGSPIGHNPGPIASRLTSLTATLYDVESGTIINGRDKQDILGTNGGLVGSSGDFSFQGDPADSVIVDSSRVGSELHILLVEWTYDLGVRAGKQEFELAVKNLSRVP